MHYFYLSLYEWHWTLECSFLVIIPKAQHFLITKAENVLAQIHSMLRLSYFSHMYISFKSIIKSAVFFDSHSINSWFQSAPVAFGQSFTKNQSPLYIVNMKILKVFQISQFVCKHRQETRTSNKNVRMEWWSKLGFYSLSVITICVLVS